MTSCARRRLVEAMPSAPAGAVRLAVVNG